MKVRGKAVTIAQENNYPWDGDLKFTISPKQAINFSLAFRIPGWAQDAAIPSDLYRFQNTSKDAIVITINGRAVNYKISNGYAVLQQVWKKGDVVAMKLPMEVKRVVANEALKMDEGKVALQRGPLMYCAEWVDNNGKASNILLPDDVALMPEYQPSLLNGVTVLKGFVPVMEADRNAVIETKKKPFMAIPYYAWANRGEGEMMLWFKKDGPTQ